mmetsp:Transcript_90013/g.253956  ORF Transcript_90013/g.253956 Transcript_90013/m.253956 type:complete len:555 (+) Transcript_90013:79-1743(+)
MVRASVGSGGGRKCRTSRDAGTDTSSGAAASAQPPTPSCGSRARARESDAALATAAEAWAAWGEQRQERFLATLDAELARLLKALPHAKDLAAVAEVQGLIRIAALASLHHHLHAPKGATHTGLQRALQLTDQGTRLQARVIDALADRRGGSSSQLFAAARGLAAEAESLTASVAKLAGIAGVGAAAGAAGGGVALPRAPKVVPTRGKTAPGRLRRLDAFLCHDDVWGLCAADGVLVDLGFGFVAVTTVELARMLWRSRPNVQVIGIESDRVRADIAARSWKEQAPADLKVLGPTLSRHGKWTCKLQGSMDFRHGGFLMPLAPEERPKVVAVRAMNVLRQYESLAECRKAHRTVVGQLAEGGVLLEGSSDPIGDVVAVHVLRRPPVGGAEPFVHEAMFFALNLRRLAREGGLSLDLVAENLPQLLYGRTDGPFEDFFRIWRAAVAHSAAAHQQLMLRQSGDGRGCGSRPGDGVRLHFVLAGRRLVEMLPGSLGEVVVRKRWLRRGWLLWRHPPYPGGDARAAARARPAVEISSVQADSSGPSRGAAAELGIDAS